jgi:hypothetical protein
MSLNIDKILKVEKDLLALTGYKSSEFLTLCSFFSKAYESFIKSNLIDSKKKRERQTRKPRKNALLPTDEHRLFFVLYYQKLNPIQSQMALQFNMDQSQVSKRVSQLLPLLEKALDEYLVENDCQIEQNPKRIGYKTQNEEEIVLDVTERPIQRSLDNEQQREDFSGKKKTLRKKSSAVITTRIHFVRK